MLKWKVKVVGCNIIVFLKTEIAISQLVLSIPTITTPLEQGEKSSKNQKSTSQFLFTSYSSKEQNHANNSKISNDNNPWAIKSAKTFATAKETGVPLAPRETVS